MPRRAKSRPKTSPRAKAKDKAPAVANGSNGHAPGSNRNIAFDYFMNAMARMGYGTPSLAEGTSYVMERLSNNYWLMLTLYRNHWLARRIVDLPAQDMTRAWPKLVTDFEPDDIKQFDQALRRTYTVRRIRQALKWARLYGGAGALMVIKGHENILEEPLDLDDVNPDSYLGLIPFDRWVGIYPKGTAQDNMAHPRDWGLPEFYEVRGQDTSQSFNVHASRIIRFTGPDVPTPELQAQMYWGISVIELAYEELRKKDNASWSILQLLFRANVIARIEPDLAQLMSGLGMSSIALQQFNQRMQIQNEMLSNQSMMVLGKDGDMKSLQYSFGGIGEVYSQFQMDVAGAVEIPVTRLFGRTISGLGQSNDADERYYEEMIAQKQDEELRPALDKLYPVICMSEFGEVPDDLDMKFPSIRVLTEEEKADLTEKASASVLAAYDSGIVGRKTALQELRQLADTTNIFSNITDEIIDKAEEEPKLPGEDLLDEGGGKSPEEILRKESNGAMDSRFRSMNGAVGEEVHDLMMRRSFDLEKETKGTAVYSRHDGDIRLHIKFDGDDVKITVAEFSGYDRKRVGKSEVSRKGWKGLQSFAGSFGDAFDARALHKRIKWHGLDISIENKAGSVRRGKNHDGTPWAVKLTHDYGYLLKTEGVDGDHVDCFIGPDAEAEEVYVIHTMKAPDFVKYDEDKCMLNFGSAGAARAAFFANYDRPEHFGSMDTLPVGKFIDRVLATKDNPSLITE